MISMTGQQPQQRELLIRRSIDDWLKKYSELSLASEFAAQKAEKALVELDAIVESAFTKYQEKSKLSR